MVQRYQEITQGDDGVEIDLFLSDNNAAIDITNAIVKATIKYKSYSVEKECVIVDATIGHCQLVLNSNDTMYVGLHAFQISIEYLDGRKFSSNDIYRYNVKKNIGMGNPFPPPPIGGGGSVSIGDSSTNGNILVNGTEIQVYDDANVKSLIDEKSTVSTSIKNGKLLIDGNELTVYDDSALSTDVTTLKGFQSLLERLGISANGLLTIDGIEQSGIGGESEEMVLVVKDYFEGSSNITKTYTEDMIGFDITNDHSTTGLTFTINGLTIPVKAMESYSAKFAPYKSLTINTTIPYRATVSTPLNGIAPAEPDTTAPSNVTGLTTSNITTSSLTLSWSASSSTDTVGYDIYQGETLLTTVTGTSYNVTSLSPDASYTFTVKAKDGSNNISSGTSVTVSTSAPDLTAPNEVTNLATSNITATSLTLSWTASTSSDIASYEVYNGSTLLSTVTGTTYNVNSLVASTGYTFTVKAKDTSNNVSTGVSVNATTTNVADTTAPNNVTNLTTSNLSDVSVTLNWTASTSSDTASYDIYRNGTFLVNTANTSYTVTGLNENTQYTFSVRAKDGANNIATGTEVTITTLDLTAPANVTNLASSNITQTGVTLTWTASTSTDVANYQIYNGTTNIGQASGTTFEISGLTAGAQYNFVVKAKDASSNESTGTSISVITLSGDITAPVLTITPAATFTDTQTVTMSTNETATIYYTLDGTTPTTASSVYSTALTLSVTTTVKAFAKDSAGNESAIQSVTYTKDAIAPIVTISPIGGNFSGTQQVTITTNETSAIYYTLDGTIPTESSTVYGSPITINATTTIKYFAKDPVGNSSAVETQTYTLVPKYYMSMNGTSDYVQLPSLTFDEIQMDFSVAQFKASQFNYYFDGRVGSQTYFTRTDTGKDEFGGETGTNLFIDGKQLYTLGSAGNTASVSTSLRITLKMTMPSSVTDDLTIFGRNNAVDLMQGDIYHVRLYNAGTLVANYDFTKQFTGTEIPDSSGNGNVATLYGGTRVEDTSVSPTTTTSYYLELNGTDGRVYIPTPSNVKYIELEVSRENSDTSGYVFDARPRNTVYSASVGVSGYNAITIDNISKTVAISNATTDLSNGVKSTVKYTLTNLSKSGSMTIGTGHIASPPTSDFLNVKLYGIRLYNNSNSLIEEFDFTSGTGNKLYGSDGMNGTIVGGVTWTASPY